MSKYSFMENKIPNYNSGIRNYPDGPIYLGIWINRVYERHLYLRWVHYLIYKIIWNVLYYHDASFIIGFNWDPLWNFITHNNLIFVLYPHVINNIMNWDATPCGLSLDITWIYNVWYPANIFARYLLSNVFSSKHFRPILT